MKWFEYIRGPNYHDDDYPYKEFSFIKFKKFEVLNLSWKTWKFQDNFSFGAGFNFFDGCFLMLTLNIWKTHIFLVILNKRGWIDEELTNWRDSSNSS